MTRRQRTELVEVRADLILGGGCTAGEYALHFETQMHRGKLRRLLDKCYVRFVARGGAAVLGFDPRGIW